MRKTQIIAATVAAMGILTSAFAQSGSSSPGATNSDPAMSTMPGREGSGTNAGPNPTVPGPSGSGNASGVPSTGGFGSGGNVLPDSRGAVRSPSSSDVNCPPGSSTAQCGPTPQTR